MATFEIKMPKLGESITEGTIVSWSVKVGDTVNEDDVLFEVNTAKVSAEIPSPVAGKVLKILANEGDTIAVGVVVALIQLDGEDGDEPANDEPANETSPAAAEPTESTTPPAEPVKNSKGSEDRWYSPVVLSKAQEAGIGKEELDAIPGTGYQGRLSKKDIDSYIGRKKTGAPASAPKPVPTPQAAVAQPSPAPVPQPAAPSTPSVPVVAGAEDEVIAMDPVRRIIADRMTASKKISPHVTTIVEVDMTKLVRWREKNKDAFKKREGVSLTFMSPITEATAKALKDFPRINSSVDGYNIIQKKRINIGIAVSLNDGNLIVPVIKDADKLSISGLAASISTVADKARKNKLMPDDIQGGTFTISNFGSFKSLISTPIINQPEVAILGVGAIEKKPAIIETPEGDVIAIRHKMYLSLSFDHRVIDGSLGGEFVRRVADYLENWNE
ncbi:dihydrolipoamide acetyltransferase family protein [Massilibacteroides sp.]|uniref:dihydrolipoamide acetyltransferase family protein n=1 Tax=Massilibacteroides sp. TaxID=2034766 RepID=UPI00262C1BD2|nr:dihydrolipoamide acetyltransferase family protein [Massilibacteroides sp.]MDD4514585.1 dihydrolipoamide acetyltransferase family protein [Massilibacteroides sp.]